MAPGPCGSVSSVWPSPFTPSVRTLTHSLVPGSARIAEPGGAVAVAACLFRRKELPSAGTTVAVLSGGNIDPGMLLDILAGDPSAGPESGE